MPQMVTVDVQVKAATDADLLVTDGTDEVRVPRSQVGAGGTVRAEASLGDEGTIEIPKWLAVRGNLV
jgi:hypothetical protein